MPFYERGTTRIYYEEVGSGFPLMIISGGGLNSSVDSLNTGYSLQPHGDIQGRLSLHRRRSAKC